MELKELHKFDLSTVMTEAVRMDVLMNLRDKSIESAAKAKATP